MKKYQKSFIFLFLKIELENVPGSPIHNYLYCLLNSGFSKVLLRYSKTEFSCGRFFLTVTYFFDTIYYQII